VGVIAQEVGTAFPDTVTIDLSSMSTSVSGSSYYYNTGAGVSGSSGTITIGSGGAGGYSIGNITASTFSWKNEEFVDCLPDFERVKSMCEQYPGLKIAYDKFVTTYKLVKDDYDSPKD
jgi:hypothetical protein